MLNRKCFVFDIDGTIALDGTLFNGSLQLFDFLSKWNKDYYFVTNNSSKSVNDYLLKFEKMGLKVNKEKIITSGTAAISYLKKYNENNIYFIGTPSYEKEILENGIKIVEYPNNADFVLSSFDTSLDYTKLEQACYYLLSGTKLIATNPDLFCPTQGGGRIPDCGAITKLLESVTNVKAEYIGKPNLNILSPLFEKGYSEEDIVMVGDRLYTDIALGNNNLIKTVHLLTGAANEESPDGFVIKADYTFENILCLYEYLQAELLNEVEHVR